MNQNHKYIVVTGGGTGGHLSVAKTFIKELVSKNYKVIFVGSTKGQDRQWFENEPLIHKSYFLSTTTVVNQSGLGKVKSLFKVLQGMTEVLKVFKEYKIEKVISVGGFSAASASFASIAARKKLYIHEQNAHMGKLNQITSKFARELFSSYDSASTINDYPVNEEFFQFRKTKKRIDTIIFLGGSQGAKAINDFALGVAEILKQNGINIIHQTGKNDFQRVKQEYENLNIEVDLFDFSPQLLEKMKDADFAVSRSGASTLWELCALGTPALFIPYPYAAANHQYHNAKFIAEKDLGYLKTEENLTKEILNDILKSDLEKKSLKLQKLIVQNGTKSIIDFVIND